MPSCFLIHLKMRTLVQIKVHQERDEDFLIPFREFNLLQILESQGFKQTLFNESLPDSMAKTIKCFNQDQAIVLGMLSKMTCLLEHYGRNFRDFSFNTN